VYDGGVERSAELRLPTIAVPVRLAIVGQSVTFAELFVADVPRRGRSHLLDDIAALLDSIQLSFVPVRGPNGVRLYSKDAIAWVAVRRRVTTDRPSTDFSTEEPSEVFQLYDRQHRVEVELSLTTEPRKMSGILLDSSAADRPRVVDHLNCSVQFVRLWTPDEHFLINKHQIVAVTEETG
jgi:hypothetical protein